MIVRNDISRFRDQNDAGHRLAGLLKNSVPVDALVLSFSLNGIPVAYSLASVLGLEYDLLIHHPQKNELYRNDDSVFSGERLNKEYHTCTGRKNTSPLKGRVVIITDEGLESIEQMMLCIAELKKENPAKIIVALPVGPSFPIKQLNEIADEVICILTPVNFISSNQFYEKHQDVSPSESRAFFELNKNVA